VLRGVSCPDGEGHTIVTPFFDHTVCPGGVVSNCFGRLLCGGESCSAFPAPTGSYSGESLL
jgi:hypothetical protein